METFKLKQIPNYPGYFASTNGDIYSYWFKTTQTKCTIETDRTPRKLKPAKNGDYLYVNLKSDKRRMVSVHKAVCMAFHGPRPSDKYQCSHLDGNSFNNCYDNLCWELCKDNLNRKKIHGTHDIGANNSRAKINNEQLAEIRKLLKDGTLTHKQIGEIFGVSRVFITKIKNGHRYNNFSEGNF